MNKVNRLLTILTPVVYTLSTFAAQRCPELSSIAHHDNVVNQNQCAIVLYYAPWCSACKGMHSQLEAAAKDHYKVSFAKADLDTNGMKPLLKKLNIKAYPTTIAYKNGKVVRREEGSLSPQEINQMAQQIQQEQPIKKLAPAPIKAKKQAPTKQK